MSEPGSPPDVSPHLIAAGAPAPIPGAERDRVVDALRGAALLGVLAVNLFAMGHPLATGLGASAETSPDGWAIRLLHLAFTGKAYALLALLFGFGVGAQVLHLGAAGADPRPVLRRRFLALGAIGVAHGLLGWYGDILVSYALFGLCLLPFLRARTRTLLWWAGGLLLGAALCFLALGLVFHLAPGLAPRDSLAETIRAQAGSDAASALLAYGQGPYRRLLIRRLFDWLSCLGNNLETLPEIMALILLGLAAARAGLTTDPARRPRLVAAALLAAVVGLPVNAIHARLAGAGMAVDPASDLFTLTAYTVSAPALAVAAAATLFLLRETAPIRALVGALAPLGRVSLSAYLLQTVVFVNVFYFHGLGLYGKLSYPVLLALAPAFWLVEVLLARRWLARFRLGPAEWLLRGLAYGRRQSF